MIETARPVKKEPNSFNSFDEFLSNQNHFEHQLVSENYRFFLDAFLAWKFEFAHVLSQGGTGSTASKKGIWLNPTFVSMSKTLEQVQLSLNNFEFCKLLSRGAFGEVFLVCEKFSGKYCAIKVLKKLNMINQQTTAFVMEECEVMNKAVGAQWLMKSECVFQDAYNIYFVMEYYSSGDLMSLLCKQVSGFDEIDAQFYAAELLLAIEELHAMGFVHRDIKPDNLLIDKHGHIKLTDFGSCGRLDNGKIYQRSTVGTPDYISPEVLLTKEENEEPYGAECDIWSFGIVLYELLFGDPPFLADSLLETYAAILSHTESLKFPEHVVISSEAKDLLLGTITDKQQRYSLQQIKQHSFFRGINWEKMKEMKAPYIPPDSQPNDTSAFDETSSNEIAVSTIRIPASSQSFFIGCTTSKESIKVCESKPLDVTPKRKAEIKDTIRPPQDEITQTKVTRVQSGLSINNSSNIVQPNLLVSRSIFDFSALGSFSLSKDRLGAVAKSKSSLLTPLGELTVSTSNYSSSSLLITKSPSMTSFAGADKKSFKLLQQEYKALEQRFNSEVAKRQNLEEQLATALQQNESQNNSEDEKFPPYLTGTLLLGNFSSSDFTLPNSNHKSTDFFGIFRKQMTVNLRNGKLGVINKQKSKSNGNIDFLFDLCDNSLLMRAYRKDGQYYIELVKNPQANSPLSQEDAQLKLTKIGELIQKEKAIQSSLKEMPPITNDSKSKMIMQDELQLSQLKIYFMKQEKQKLIKEGRDDLNLLESVPSTVECFNGHCFVSRFTQTASILTINERDNYLEKGKGSNNSEGECFVCGKFLQNQVQNYSKLLHTCNFCGCKCHPDCIPLVSLSCSEYTEYRDKEPFFVLATKSKETFAKWSHLIDLSIKMQV